MPDFISSISHSSQTDINHLFRRRYVDMYVDQITNILKLLTNEIANSANSVQILSIYIEL